MEPDRQRFVRAWFEEWSPERPVFGCATKVLVDKIASTPQVAWGLILELVESAPDDDALGWVGSGPLEDLLSEWGPDFIERVEVLTQSNDRFKRCLADVWGWSRIRPDVYARMRRSIEP